MHLDTSPKFSPGFRFSTFDIGVLLIGVVVAALLSQTNLWFAAAVAFAVGHFFLFCNVLRIRRLPELVWAGVFVMLVFACHAYGLVTWPSVFGYSFSLTIILAIIEMRHSSYHGVGWRKLNPGLPQWFARRFPGGV